MLLCNLFIISGKLAKENIVLKVDDLKRKLEVIKLDVEEALKHKYVDFIPQYIKMDKLLLAFKRFSEDYEQLHNQIEKEVCKTVTFILLISYFFSRLQSLSRAPIFE